VFIVFILMRVLAWNANVCGDRPLGSTPNDTIPSHIRIVFDIFIVQLDTPDAN
jgi:hypothetical protein